MLLEAEHFKLEVAAQPLGTVLQAGLLAEHGDATKGLSVVRRRSDTKGG